MSNYNVKDVISELGLPDDLNKRLENLLKVEKKKDGAYAGSKDPRMKDLSKARKEFRKAYKGIRKQGSSCEKESKKESAKDGLESEDEKFLSNDSDNSSRSSSDITDFEDANPDDILENIPSGVLTDEQKRGIKKEKDKLKFLESQYLQKKNDLDRALKEMDNEESMDAKLMRKMVDELDADTAGYDYNEDNEEMDRIIEELKEMTKHCPLPKEEMID